MSYLLRIAGVGGVIEHASSDPTGQYVAEYDPEAHGGRGEFTGTYVAAKALRFETAEAALECWRRQSRTRPLREDGRPNRPLTALTVEVVRAP